MPSEVRRSTKEIVAEIRASRHQIEATISRLPIEQLTSPVDEGGWSIKDHLVHLAEWQRHALAVLNGTPAHEARGIDRDIHDKLDIDELNQILFERNQHRPVSDVLEAFRHTHAAAIDIVLRMSESDLQRELPQEVSPEPARVIDVVAGVFIRHVREHTEMIQLLSARNRA